MSYLVLARKWRPKTFSEVAGQEHVLRALINALDNDRLHHAFLFSGTRGVGKTTLARIFAKSINCERGVSSTPCGECSACVEIDQGRYVDLLEVDAASRTRVDDTRELLDNVQYAPTRGRYKVYLIDEVHMLSTHSFNALLKTLEEPPAHVKFLLATTDPQKLPVTVLSRCLQFNLKRLPPTVIEAQLTRIAHAEGYAHEASALSLLAGAADGSMRDALSLLDQAIAHAGGNLERDAVADMLGTVDRTHVLRLLEALTDGDGAALMGVASELAERGLGADSVLSELASGCQQLALAQVVPDALAERVQDAEAIHALATRAPADAVQLWYQIAVNGRRDLPLAPTPWLGLEMTLLRMLAFQVEVGGEDDSGHSASASGSSPRGKPASRSGAAKAAVSKASASPTPASQDQPNGVSSAGRTVASKESRPQIQGQSKVAAEVPTPKVTPLAPAAPTSSIDAAASPSSAAPAPAPAIVADVVQRTTPTPADPPQQGDWERFAQSLGASGMLRQLADNSVIIGVDGKILRLQVDETREHLLTAQQCSAMEQSWREHRADQGWRLDFSVGQPQTQTAAQRAEIARTERHAQAVQSMREDPYVRALQQTFGAELIEETVQPRQAPARTAVSTVATAKDSAPSGNGRPPAQAPHVREAGGR
ncbi:MAG: DNA polymerase III subunit gamma/tau [Pseudomonadota bacterium]